MLELTNPWALALLPLPLLMRLLPAYKESRDSVRVPFFDKLVELKAVELFWQGIPGEADAAGHLERIRSRVDRFEQKISEIDEKQARLQAQIDRRNDELAYLHQEVQEAYEREERRREEFVIEREISPVPYRAMIMPWTKQTESERRFHRAVLVAMLICIFFGILIPQVNVPLPNYTAAVVKIPERLARLVKKEPPRPSPAPKPVPKEPEEETQKMKDESKPEPEKKKPDKALKNKTSAPEPPKVAKKGGGKTSEARKTLTIAIIPRASPARTSDTNRENWHGVCA